MADLPCVGCQPTQPASLLNPVLEGLLMQVVNTNPVGEVFVPLLDRTVGAGETITVPDAQAAALLPQEANWAPADKQSIALLAKMKGI